jgi:HEAT repeat protein
MLRENRGERMTRCLTCSATGSEHGGELPDLFSLDVAKFRKQLACELPAVRVAGVQGLSYLRHHSFENDLIRALDDEEAPVRRESALALGRLGRSTAVMPLIAKLSDPAYEVRTQAAMALVRITGHEPTAALAADASCWREWWQQMSPDQREASLIAALAEPSTRSSALRRLRRLGGARTEAALIELAGNAKLGPRDIRLLLAALEPVATHNSLELLEQFGGHSHAVAWALGNVGGLEAERILVKHIGAYGIEGLINLDRLRWEGAFPFAPILVQSFGLVSYRSQPDDLHNPPTPRQRLAAQLLLRSGRAAEVVDVILSKLDGQPIAVAKLDDPTVQALLQIVGKMDEELQPGFHRADGYAQSTALSAMSHLVRDTAHVPRLINLLDHPAYVVRVYAGKALGNLQARPAVEPIAEILGAGYPFDDATHQASGKHGPEISRFVRWKGYLAMALGRIGGDQAREVLEELAVDASAPRDLRFGAVVGLGSVGDEQSRAALIRVAEEDTVRWIRQSARRSLREIELHPYILEPNLREGLVESNGLFQN